MDQLEQLKALLLSEDRAELERLKQAIDDQLSDVNLRTEQVASILPAALALSADRDPALSRALADPVSDGLKRSIEKEPKYYGDILYPVLAPAIRQAISQAMSSLLATIQRTLESTTTASGISLRVKSLTTGVPYAELALLQSLVFRVEHVYLIERDTGILIKQLSDSSAQALDSDAVGAMFSAIESFVNDSFSGEQGDRLTDLKVGERNVWVGHGPKLMLACVIFGDAPESLKADLRDTLDQIRIAYAAELNQADAGELLLADVDNYLEHILQSEAKESEIEVKRSKSMVLLGIVLLGLLGYGLFQSFSERMTFDSLQSVLANTPGIVVTDIRQEDDRYFISGLRDPEAELPLDRLSNLGVGAEQLEVMARPFLSLEPEIEVRRFVRQLSPPEGVQVVYQDSKVKLLGAASLLWTEKHSDSLLSLKRDGRISLQGFEVSATSVRELLLRDLGDDATVLAGAVVKAKVIEGLNGLEIDGELSQAQRAVLSRYFANSPWVHVADFDGSISPSVAPNSVVETSQSSAATFQVKQAGEQIKETTND